ncbi:putative ammonia monooxygenase [compost metagenome]
MKPLPWLELIRLQQLLQWAVLVGAGGLTSFLLHNAGLPAAPLLGPMLVAICMGAAGARIQVPRILFRSGQGLVGLMVAKSVTLGVLMALSKDWYLMLLVTALTILLSAGVGLGLACFSRIPADASAWGTAPGAASAMIAMAEEGGSDGRLVACMQYVRVVCVVMLGAWVSQLLVASSIHLPGHINPESPFTWLGLGSTLALAILGAFSGNLIPAGALLTSVIFGSAFQLAGWLDITLSETLMALAYGAIGSYIGLRFNRATIIYVAKLLPVIAFANLVLILLCAILAWPLSHLFGKDFLSMFLATSPGGLDAMAIMAVETGSDASFVVALQTLRLLAVVVSGAFCSQLIISWASRLSR